MSIGSQKSIKTKLTFKGLQTASVLQIPSTLLRGHVRGSYDRDDVLLLGDGEGALGLAVHRGADAAAGRLYTLKTKSKNISHSRFTLVFRVGDVMEQKLDKNKTERRNRNKKWKVNDFFIKDQSTSTKYTNVLWKNKYFASI